MMRQFFHLSTDSYIGQGSPFIVGTTQYPANWIEHASAEDIAGLGLVEVITVGMRRDDRYFDNAETMSDGTLTITSASKNILSIKVIKAQEIADARYALEVSGVTLSGGIQIKTDRESQSMIAGALLRVQRNPSVMIDWKGSDGWWSVNKSEIEAIADAVSDHVQACFSAERAAYDALNALTDLDEIIAFNPTLTLV